MRKYSLTVEATDMGDVTVIVCGKCKRVSPCVPCLQLCKRLYVGLKNGYYTHKAKWRINVVAEIAKIVKMHYRNIMSQ